MAKEMSESGVLVIIIGDPHHPEVLGIKNWCPGDVKIIENVEDAKNFFYKQRSRYCGSNYSNKRKC